MLTKFSKDSTKQKLFSFIKQNCVWNFATSLCKSQTLSLSALETLCKQGTNHLGIILNNDQLYYSFEKHFIEIIQ